MDRFIFVAIFVLAVAADIDLEEYLEKHNIFVKKTSNYNQHLNDMQIAYRQKERFIKDVHKIYKLEEIEKIERFGDEQNCWSETKVITPYVIKTDFIIQLPNYVQNISVTTCWKNDIKRHCFQDIFQSSTTIEAKCDVTNTYTYLYIYDPKDRKMAYKPYKIPVACSCKFRKLGASYGK